MLTKVFTDETCLSRTGRMPISCRWQNINNGNKDRVEVRSRLIAREIKQVGTDKQLRRSITMGTRTMRDQQGCDENKKQGDDDNSWY